MCSAYVYRIFFDPFSWKELKLIAFLKNYTGLLFSCTHSPNFNVTSLQSNNTSVPDNSNSCLSTSSSSSSVTNLVDTSVTVTDVRITYYIAIQPIMTQSI